MTKPTALITGASQGLGRALAQQLASTHRLVLTARTATDLEAVASELRSTTDVVALPGDVGDFAHAHALIDATRARFGSLDVLIHNASSLGPTPLPRLRDLGTDEFANVYHTNVFAPLHLTKHALDLMSGGTIVTITSDAAVSAYPGWGAYGSSKAALEQLSAILAAELDERFHVIVADPGDMNTAMHRAAIPEADPAQLRDPADSARALAHAVTGAREHFARIAL